MSLPAGWATAPLGEVVEILDSRRVPINSAERETRQGAIPYYGATGQVGWIDDFLFDEELILLGEDGAPFLDPAKPKAYMIAGKSWVNNHAHVLKARNGLLNRFLLHQLNCVDYHDYVSGTTRLKLPQAPMREIPMRIAPGPEQDRIVAEIEKQFTRLDDAVGALKRVQANLKRYRASVLKAACEGRLVPTEAELARKEGRDYEPASELLKRILAERRAKWESDQLQKMIAAGKPSKNEEWKNKYREPQPPETSALSQLPEGWVWASVEQLSTKVVDGVHKKPDYVPTGVPFVTVKNLTAGPGISFRDLNYVTQADHQEFTKRANPERGDILVSKDGTLGVIRAIRTGEVFSIFVSVAMIKPVLTELTDYLELALSSPQVQIQMVPKGSGLQHIHLEDLREDCIPLPPIAEGERIVTAAARHLSIIDSLERDVGKRFLQARALRNSILHSAFSGKLVPQDPHNEPASVLLDRIRAERARAQEQKQKTPKAANGTLRVNGQRRRRVAELAQGVSPGKG
ncbi:MAG: restriction endonuclease subunit S [Alphaproteobacteria bacterium]